MHSDSCATAAPRTVFGKNRRRMVCPPPRAPLMQSGMGEVNQYGRVATVHEGEAVLTANGAEATFTGQTPTVRPPERYVRAPEISPAPACVRRSRVPAPTAPTPAGTARPAISAAPARR